MKNHKTLSTFKSPRKISLLANNRDRKLNKNYGNSQENTVQKEKHQEM